MNEIEFLEFKSKIIEMKNLLETTTDMCGWKKEFVNLKGNKLKLSCVKYWKKKKWMKINPHRYVGQN